MFETVGHHVEKIQACSLRPLHLDVEPGKLRPLDAREVEELKSAAEGRERSLPGNCRLERANSQRYLDFGLGGCARSSRQFPGRLARRPSAADFSSSTPGRRADGAFQVQRRDAKAVANTPDLFDMVSNCLKHFSDLPVAPFDQVDFIPGIIAGLNRHDLCWSGTHFAAAIGIIRRIKTPPRSSSIASSEARR